MHKHIKPNADIICYCLMPIHFHILLCPNELGCGPSKILKLRSRIDTSKNVKEITDYQQLLSQLIGVMLSTYTKAINKQEKRSGSLFRSKTKVKDGWVDEYETVKKRNDYSEFANSNNYAALCFQYIHKNPVKAKLIEKETEWIYSSAKEYAGIRNGTLCNLDIGCKNMKGLI